MGAEHPMLMGADSRPLPAPPVPVPSYPSSGSGSSSSSSSTSHLASPPVSHAQGGGLRAPVASAAGCAGVRRNLVALPPRPSSRLLLCRLVSSHQTQKRSACECGGVRSGWTPVSGSLCPVGLFSTVSAPRLHVHGRAGGHGWGPRVLGAHPPRSPRPQHRAGVRSAEVVLGGGGTGA